MRDGGGGRGRACAPASASAPASAPARCALCVRVLGSALTHALVRICRMPVCTCVCCLVHPREGMPCTRRVSCLLVCVLVALAR
eukprot:6178283-Pleurochrysis_carterae.AAC.2